MIGVQDVLKDFSEFEKYDLPLNIKVKYAAGVLVKNGNYSCFNAFPEDVKVEMLAWIRGYRTSGRLGLLSSDGIDDLSELMDKLIEISPD